jgi:bile acid transporter
MSTAETAFTVMSVGCLFVIGLGLGAASTTEDFKKALAKPKAVAIGFASQYVFMPVFAYILTLIFGIDEYIAIGCVLVGASPGGTTSNIFTYWSKGDTALSITMSLMSTTAAFFMMPFWIWLLVVVAFDSDAEIAWTNIVVSLLLIIIPTLIGLATRYYNTETTFGGKFIWEWIEIGTSIFGVIFLVSAFVLSIVIYEDIFAASPWSVWVMACILQPVACLFGYWVARWAGMTMKDQRTISLETGVQSFTLTIAVINLTFEDTVLKKALMFPLAYGILYFANSAGLVAFYRYYLAPLDGPEEEEDKDEKKEPSGAAAEEGAVEEGGKVPTEEPSTEVELANNA